jgi:hypothetical protein
MKKQKRRKKENDFLQLKFGEGRDPVKEKEVI